MNTISISEVSLTPHVPNLTNRYSFSLVSGNILSISGQSGIGKSLLLKAIADLIPHTGRIELNSQAQENYVANIWRKKVMLVPAESQWWLDTVKEHFINIDHNLLEQLNLSTQTFHQSIHELSSGEKQRLAILRAIQLKPKVLLLDEATANLDEQNKLKVEAVLHRYISNQKAIIIWVGHDKPQQERISTQHIHITKNKIETIV